VKFIIPKANVACYSYTIDKFTIKYSNMQPNNNKSTGAPIM